jgi:threonylcarbamoyladenosine tRNA methylthiotransferase MtaB
MEVDDRVLSVMQRHRHRFAEHFHVPLQSGSPSVLERMNRPYTRERYEERVRAIRAAFPEAAIGADVIVGFPGETDTEFQETADLVAALPLTYLHVFAYSDRPGTPASAMPGKVRPEVIEERSVLLRSLGATKRAAFERSFVGYEQRALVLNQRGPEGRLIALTGTYIEVSVGGSDDLVNRFAQVRVERPAPDGGWQGTVVSVETP